MPRAEVAQPGQDEAPAAGLELGCSRAELLGGSEVPCSGWGWGWGALLCAASPQLPHTLQQLSPTQTCWKQQLLYLHLVFILVCSAPRALW